MASEFENPKAIEIENTMIHYNLTRTKRRTVGIQVKPGGIVDVRAPNIASQQAIQTILQKKQKWILRKVKEFSAVEILDEKELKSGETLFFLGQEHDLKIEVSSHKRITITKNESEILIHLPQQIEASPARERLIAKHLLKWYRKQAQMLIIPRAEDYAQKIGVKPKFIKIRKMKKRWGSCSSEGKVTINLKLIMAPLQVVDYVIIHELSHLVHFNHSKSFWKFVEHHCPSFKIQKQWLRIHQFRLNTDWA